MRPAYCTRCLLSSCLWPCPASACLRTWPVPVLPFVTGWGDDGAQHVLRRRLFSMTGGKGRNCAGQECRLHGLVLVIPRRSSSSSLHHDAGWGRRLVLLRLRSLLLPSTRHGSHGDRPGSLEGFMFGDTRHLALHELFLPNVHNIVWPMCRTGLYFDPSLLPSS